MTMKSIIFNQHQVNHALKNKEGMFRVVIKPYPILSADKSYWEFKGIRWAGENSSYARKFGDNARPKIPELTPYQVGETIFVKESWNKDQGVIYKADSLEANVEWIGASYMSKWASRLTLRIRSVKVERLADINEEDAVKSGTLIIADTPKQSFAMMWNETHKKPEEKFEANPFCFVYEYEVINKPSNG